MDGEYWEEYKKEVTKKETNSRGCLVDSSDVLARSQRDGRAPAESPLKLWWLEQQKVKEEMKK